MNGHQGQRLLVVELLSVADIEPQVSRVEAGAFQIQLIPADRNAQGDDILVLEHDRHLGSYPK